MRWNMNPILFELGPVEIRWYGLFFAIGILLGARAMPRTFAKRGLNPDHAERLTIWIVVGMIIGAHLIHLVFYEPSSFIHNPRRIIEIGVGLASHGGGLGSIIAIALFCKRHKLEFFRHADASMLSALWVIPWVRIGNFFNSEIFGRPTDLPWGVIFAYRGQTIPRHPSQIYESLIGFSLLALALYIDHKFRDRMRPGAMLFLLLGLYFLTRFFVEYVKEYQVLSPSFPLTMGQCLSLPIFLLCGYLLLFTERFNLLKRSDQLC